MPALDKDLDMVEEAAVAVMTIDRRYRKANLAKKVKLKPARNKAFNNYARARLKLLEPGTISTQADLDNMKEIRLQIGRARKVQTLVEASLKMAALLAKFV